MRRPWKLGVLVAAIAFVAQPSPAQTPTCQTVKPPAGVFVNLDDTTNRQAIAHVRDAVARGQPRELTWDPAGADARRKASLRGFPTWGQLTLKQRQAIDPDRPDVLHDRDEYPPASSRQGGAGADVRYIVFSDNRSAGTRMESQMDDFCVGTRFVVEP